jgi:phospholipid transport system transporter-binding protein
MAAADPRPALSLRRDGPVLHLSGILDRAAASAAWPALLPLLDGATSLDLAGVEGLDSAGLALLAEAAARLSMHGEAARLTGTPTGLSELRAAYRLDETLAFADSAP